MKRLAPSLLMVALAAACADNHTLLIIGNQVPDPGCIIAPSLEGPFISNGFLDVQQVPGLASGYLFTPVIQSSAVGNTSDVNRHIAMLKGADIELLGSGIPGSATTAFFSGAVQPGGLTAIGFVIVDGVQAAALDATMNDGDSFQMLARVTVFAEMEGTTIETPPYDYPITVCKKCLVRNLGLCSANTTEPRTGGECFPLQDGFLDCCREGTNTICPATVAPPPP